MPFIGNNPAFAGADGAQGFQGSQGPQGPQGLTGTLSSAGSNTQLVYVNSGTASGSPQLNYINTRNELQTANHVIKVNALGSITGSATINLANGNYVTATAIGPVTWAVTNLTGGSSYASYFVLELTNGGSATQTWMTNVRWPSGIAPSLSSSGVDILAFITDDNGANWRGVLSIDNSL